MADNYHPVVRAYGLTDTGAVRNGNEDYYLVDQQAGLFLVADGMGGHSNGEVASEMAADRIRDCLGREPEVSRTFVGEYSREANMLAAAIRLANAAIFEAAGPARGRKRMGTTVAAALLRGERIAIAHVGDSRIYLVRSNSIIQLTEDHSLAARLAGEAVGSTGSTGTSPGQNIITRALGIAPTVEVDTDILPVLKGDIFLLCSDGLNSMVSDDRILSIIRSHKEPESACRALIDEANRNGGRDNVTAVIVQAGMGGLWDSLKRLLRQDKGG